MARVSLSPIGDATPAERPEMQLRRQLLLGIVGGARLASGYAGAIAFVAPGLAVRGRIGAASDVETARTTIPDRSRGQRAASGE